MIVYCELRNFTVATDEQGAYHAKLNLRLELYDAAGQVVKEQDDAGIEDVQPTGATISSSPASAPCRTRCAKARTP